MRRISGILVLAVAFLAAGCHNRRPVTRNLEEIRLNPDASAVVQAIREYQISASETYRYPNPGSWLNLNRTAGIYGTAPGQIRIFTEDDEGNFQWRDVDYYYPFYDAFDMEGNKTQEDGFLIFSSPQLSADCQAAAWQTLAGEDSCIVVEERGKPAVLLNENGKTEEKAGQAKQGEAERRDPEGKRITDYTYTWSTDGRTLLYYQAELDREWDEKSKGVNVYLVFAGIYGYDRQTGETRLVWEPMKLYLPGESNQYLYRWDAIADVADEKAVMFLLFQEDSCPDVMLLNDGGQVESRRLRLPEHPCIQIVMEEEIYYYQEEGEVRRASFAGAGQSESVVCTDRAMESFVITRDGKKVFTIETRDETKDIFLYLQDEKKNWYKQALYVGADGAWSLQLSEEQQILLVECRGEEENEALILRFAQQE